MQKNFKKDIEDKYKDILKNLYVQWKLQHKRKYEEKTKNNINGHIDNMEKDIKKIYEGDKLFTGDTNKIFLENIKNNSTLKIEKIFKEIINLRKGKKIKKLVIFDIFFTLLGFTVGVASLIVEILTISK